MKKLLVILCLLTLITVGCTKNNDMNQPTEADKPQENETPNKENTQEEDKEKIIMAPDFELETMDGTMMKLSDLRDKNVIINFWATWCGFCVAEMPDLQKLQETYKNDLIILAVNVGETKEEAQEFIEDNELELTVLLDEKGEVFNLYGVSSFPSTIAVNKKGEVVTAHVGMLTYEQMERFYGYFEK